MVDMIKAQLKLKRKSLKKIDECVIKLKNRYISQVQQRMREDEAT